MVLLVVGAVLLLSAATVFVALSWQQLGVVGQAAVMAGATAVAAVVTGLLRRAGLRAATESLAAVTAGLVVLDLVGARTFDLLGLGGVDVALYVAVSATVVAALSTWVVGVTVAGRRGIVTAVVTACAAVPVAVAAAVDPLAGAVRAATPGEPVGLLGEVVGGGLEALVLLGVLLLALSRPAARVPGAEAVRRTLRVSGLVALGLAAVPALAVAAVLPSDVGDLGSLQRTAVTVVRVTGAGLVALALALVPGRRSRVARTVSAAVGAAVLSGVVPAVLVGATALPLDAAFVLVVGLLAALGRVVGERARALRDGLAVVVAAAALVAAVVLVLLVGLLMAAVEPSAQGGEWERPARSALVCVALCLVPLVVAPVLSRAVRTVVVAARSRAVTGVLALGATVVLWQGVLLLPGPWPRAVVALVSLVPVCAAAVLLVRHRRASGRWRAGPLTPEVVAGVLALQLVLGVLVVAAADETLGTDGRLTGLHLVLAGLAAAVLAAAVAPATGSRPAVGPSAVRAAVDGPVPPSGLPLVGPACCGPAPRPHG